MGTHEPEVATAYPETPARFQGIQVKMFRAHEHLLDLEREVSLFLYRKPYKIVSELSGDGHELSAHFKLTENPLLRWGSIIGDVIHNLRSALEYLAWQIVDVNGGTVDKDIKFPIYAVEDGYKNWRRPTPRKRDPFTGVDPRAIQAIENEQPYRRQDGGDPCLHPLYRLNQLWNRDKHEVLIPAIFNWPVHQMGGGMLSAMLAFSVQDFEVIEPDDQPPMVVVPVGRLDDDQCMFRGCGIVTGPNPEVYVKTDLPFDVGLDDDTPLIATLHSFGQHVAGVAERLIVFL